MSVQAPKYREQQNNLWDYVEVFEAANRKRESSYWIIIKYDTSVYVVEKASHIRINWNPELEDTKAHVYTLGV